MWEELYEKHYKELLRYAVAACKNLAEAEDAAQEVFLKALQNPDTFQDLGPSQKRAWLFRSLKNLMCDRYRRGQLENAYLEARQEQAEYWDPGIQETENRLLLAQLTPEDRTLFHLRYGERSGGGLRRRDEHRPGRRRYQSGRRRHPQRRSGRRKGTAGHQGHQRRGLCAVIQTSGSLRSRLLYNSAPIGKTFPVRRR